MPLTTKGSRRRADYRRYRQLLTERPDLFAGAADGIRILLDEAEIKAAQRHVAALNRKKGLPAAASSVGVLVEDSYILGLRDAVRFPDGSLGTHNRVVYANSRGVGILGLYLGDIILVRIFRHAVGKWILEIPRGSVERGDGLEDTARREVAEEIGGTVASLVRLGKSVCDTSLSDGGLDLYLAELSGIGAPQLSEGIGAVVAVSPSRFAEMALAGEIEDGHALSAFCLARLRGLV
ncbi:MAG: NUDIX hydrolase [Magnetospirillum sp.]|nr:NUDIX hydrolase [Magnetospirillum sp.]